jgi:hypothetical protein
VLAHERIGEALGLEELRMHAGHHDFLVVRAVEDADPAALRARGVGPPEEVVVELVRVRRLEGVHVAALGIDAGHHVLAGAVLAGRVHALEDEEQGPAILSVQLLLQLVQDGGALLEELLGMDPRLHPPRVGRVHVLEPELAAVPHAVPLGQTGHLLEDPACLHSGSLARTCLPGID